MKTLLFIQLLAFVVMLLAALSHKFNVLSFKPAFLGFLLCALVVVVLFVVALFVFVRGLVQGESQDNLSLFLLGVGAVPLVLFFSMVGVSSLKVPKIHDISTRFEPPIEFSKAQALRSVNDNSLNVADTSVHDKQRAYYTQLHHLLLSEPLTDCYEKAKASVGALGWHSIAESQGEAWIEAYEETALFGFKDDIRIELSEVDGGCRIDLRSVSRVGVSDLGVNAKRIERFYQSMQR